MAKSYKELMELMGAQTGTNAQKANAMLELIEGREPFRYDAATDPAAQTVRKETARNIGRTTQDTLGSYAAMTGGMPSSAAVSAAAQAGNYAGAQGVDRVAELEQLARQNYNAETDEMRSMWSMLQGQADAEQARADAEAQRVKAEAEAEYNKKLQMAQLAAQYGDYSGLKELGIAVNIPTGSGTTGGGYQAAQKPGSGPDGDLNREAVDEAERLMFEYSTAWPPDVYDSFVANFGEAILKEKGITRKTEQQPAQTTKTQKTKQATGSRTKTPVRIPGIAKGEKALHTRD